MKRPNIFLGIAGTNSAEKIDLGDLLAESEIACLTSNLAEEYLISGSRIYYTKGIAAYNEEKDIAVHITDSHVSVRNSHYGFDALYYHTKGQRLYFSNNLRILIEVASIEFADINPEALFHYYLFGYLPTDSTPITHISKLPAGHELRWENGHISLHEYFNPLQYYDPTFNAPEVKSLTHQLNESLAKKISEDKVGSNVGISISGGVDSGYAAQKLIQSGRKLTGISMAYGNTYTEFDRLKFLEEHLEIKIKKLVLEPHEVRSNFMHTNSIASEPCGFNNATMNLLFRYAMKEGITDLYDGDGADRLFLGMNRYLQLQKAIRLYNIGRRTGLLHPFKLLLSLHPHPEMNKLRILLNNWHAGQAPYPERILDKIYHYNKPLEETIYDRFVAKDWMKIQDYVPKETLEKDPFIFISYYAISRCQEMFFHSPSELQAIQGIRSRPAYWGKEIVPLAINLPTSLKLKGSQTKYILRQAASLNLPKQYWMLPKIGLQNSHAFACSDEAGKNWQEEMLGKVREHVLFGTLAKSYPKELIEVKKLLPMLVWYESLKADASILPKNQLLSLKNLK